MAKQTENPALKPVTGTSALLIAEQHFHEQAAPLKFDSFSDFVKSLKYRQISFAYDLAELTLWVTLKPTRPCYTLDLLQELNDFHARMRNHFQGQDYTCHDSLRYLVWRSGIPGIFNLGGDLPYFVQQIRGNEKEKLHKYALSCVEAVYNNYDNFGLPIINIALVQGDALGGGFESVMSSAVVVSEKSSQFGLPEVIFNMFPGMGAYSLLARRFGAVHAEKMILSGRICSAAELHDQGMIDVVAEDGEGEMAVKAYIQRHKRNYLSQSAVHMVRRIVTPLEISELRNITGIWVETAFKLSPIDIKKMERLANAQERRLAASF